MSARRITTLVCSDCFTECAPDGSPRCTCARDQLVRGCLILVALGVMFVGLFTFAVWSLMRTSPC